MQPESPAAQPLDASLSRPLSPTEAPLPAFPPIPAPAAPPPAATPLPSLASLFPHLNVFAQQQEAAVSSSPSASSPSSPLLRVRLIELDSYVAAPVPSLDPSHSLFSSSPLSHVPVLRVWGATPAGQRTCLHVHRYFPYLYVPMPASVPDDEREEKDFMRRLGLSLEMALREVDARRRQEQQRDAPHSPADHLYSLTLHTATDFYGYHAHRQRFIRLSLLTPACVSTAASILLSGALLGQSFQPYEAHIPYTLQFMVDAGLAGMDFVDLSWCGVRRWRRGDADTAVHCSARETVRRGLDTGMTWVEWNQRQPAAKESKEEETRAAAAEQEEKGRQDAQAAEEEQTDDANHSAASVSSSPPLSAFASTPLSSRLYLPSTLPLSLYVPGRVPRVTHCELEVDCSFYHIINRGRGAREKQKHRAAAAGADEEKEEEEAGEAKAAAKDGKRRLVRSLQMLWENEKERRRLWHQEQQERRQRRRRRRASAAETEELASTPSATSLDFSQIASSPPRQLPPPSELELALRRHLHAVAKQEKPLSQASTPTQPAPASDRQTVGAGQLKQEEGKDTVDQRETAVEAERTRTAEDDQLEAAATAVLPEEDVGHGDDEEEERKEAELGRLLQSALANAEAVLPSVAVARLPSVSSLLSSQPPVEEEQQLAAASQRAQRSAVDGEQERRRREQEDEWVMTQVQHEMEKRAEVDGQLLLASERQLRQQQEEEQESRRQRQEQEEQRLHGEEEEQQVDDGTQQEAEWEQETDAATAGRRRGGSGSGSGSGGSRGSRGRIVIEDEEQTDEADDANLSFVRIAQLDGAGDSEGELNTSPQRRRSRRQSGSSGSKRAAQLASSFSHRYSAIPLTPVAVRPAEPTEGREEKEEEEEDVVMIPSTPPAGGTARLFSRSPSPASSASFGFARRRAGSRLTQSGSGARRRRSQVRRSGAGGSAGTGRVRRSPATEAAAVSGSRRSGRRLLPLLNAAVLSAQAAAEEIEDDARSGSGGDEGQSSTEDIDEVQPTDEHKDGVQDAQEEQVDDEQSGVEVEDAGSEQEQVEVQAMGSDDESDGDVSTVYSESGPAVVSATPHAAAAAAGDEDGALQVEDSIDEIFQTQSSSASARDSAAPPPASPAVFSPSRPPSALSQRSLSATPAPPLSSVTTVALPSSSPLSDSLALTGVSHVSGTPSPRPRPVAATYSLLSPPSSQSSGEMAVTRTRQPAHPTVSSVREEAATDVMGDEQREEAGLSGMEDDAADIDFVPGTEERPQRDSTRRFNRERSLELLFPSPSPIRSSHPSPSPSQSLSQPIRSYQPQPQPSVPQTDSLPSDPSSPQPLASSASDAPSQAESEAMQKAQAEACDDWLQQWQSSRYAHRQPLRWVYAPLSAAQDAAAVASFVHVLSVPPPSAAELEASWLRFSLPPVINQEPFFSSLSHYTHHLQSSSAHAAVAHYQSSFASSAALSRSIVQPPPDAVELLPAFQPLFLSPALPSPPSLNFRPVPQCSPQPLPPLRSFQPRHLLFPCPPLDAHTRVLEYCIPPPSRQQLEAALRAEEQTGRDAQPGSQSSSSSQSSPAAVQSSSASEERSAAAAVEDDDEEEEEEAVGLPDAETELLRPASPKHEENFLSTLSYFLPPAGRQRNRMRQPTAAPSASTASVSSPSKKRARDAEPPASSASSPSLVPATPELKRPKPLFNLTTNDSPARSFFSPKHGQPPSQLSSSAGDTTSLPTFAPAAAQPSASSSEDRQHLSVLAVEAHACSRGELLPDPRMDPVCAIVAAVRWDVHGRDDERQEMHCVLLCPFLPQHSAMPASLPSPTLCPPLPFPASVSCRLFASEVALYSAFISLVRRVDPDLVYSYEIQKNGLGYLAERGRYLGLDLCLELSRVRKDDKRAQWKQRQDNARAGNEAAVAAPPLPVIASTSPPVALAAATAAAAAPAADGAVDGFSSDAGLTSDNAAVRYAFNHSSGLMIAGRIVLNLWRMMRDELKLNIYTYENVCAHVLGLRLPHFTSQVRTRWWKQGLRAWNEKREQQQPTGKAAAAGVRDEGVVGTGGVYRVLCYYLDRCVRSLQLTDCLDLIGRTSELARVFGIKFYSVLDRGSQYRVESMMLRVAKPLNFVLASLSPEQRAGQQGMEVIPLVMEPVSRLYVDPVVVLDFQSLYPSMMIAHNICFSTCLGKLPPLRPQAEATAAAGEHVTHQLGGLSVSRSASLLSSLLSSSADSLWVSPSGTVFTTPSVRQGVLPLLLRDILQTRVMVKQTMRRAELLHDRPMQRVLNARQFGLKLISNVTYGYTAAGYSGRMPCAEIADAIVSAARLTLEKAVERVEGNSSWAARVVYGDTDSLFVLLEGRTLEQAMRIGKEMADDVTRSSPSPVRLQMEKVYMPCMLVAKKRYVGIKHEPGAAAGGVLEAKGIEMVRRDGCPALVRIQEKALRCLFQHKDVTLVRRYVERQWSRLYSGQLSVRDCIFAKEVRLGTYKVMPLAAIVATNSIKLDARTAPLYGERVEYVVIDAEGSRLMDKAASPQELLRQPSRCRISASYYIEKQLIPPLSRLFDLLGVSVASWYAQWPRPRRKLYAAPLTEAEMAAAAASRGVSVAAGLGVGGRKRTIDHYYASQHCPGCDAVTTRGYCDKCRRDASTLVLKERLQRRSVEERLQQLQRICRDCIGGGYIGVRGGEEANRLYPLEIECESRDCPVLFRRHESREQSREVEHRTRLLAEVIRW